MVIWVSVCPRYAVLTIPPIAASDSPADHRHVRPLQRAAHLLLQGASEHVAAFAHVLRRAQEPERQRRHHGQRDEERRRQRDGDSDRERPEQLAGQPADQADRQKHGDRGQRRRHDRAGDLLDPGQDGVSSVFPVLEMPLDVLEYDDRVVDHPADGDRQRAQGEQVERVVAGPQRDQRDDHGQRDRHRGDQRRAQRHQEDQDHDHGEEQAERALGGQAADRRLDERRLVEHRDDRGVAAELARPRGWSR
jgi:hypothetical protein